MSEGSDSVTHMSNTDILTETTNACTDPDCDPAFPCIECTNRILTARGETPLNDGAIGIASRLAGDAPTTHRNGNGRSRGGRGGHGDRPASDRQLAYLRSLAAAAGVEVPEGLSSREASAMIDGLKNATPADTNTARWTKVDGEWALRSAGTTGDVVTVTTSKGRTSQQTLGEKVATDCYLPAPSAPEADGLDLNAIFDGLLTSTGEARTTVWVAVPGGDTRLKVQIDRPRSGRYEGHIFVHDGAAYGNRQRYGSQRPGETYRGKIEDALRAIVADPQAAMAAYGHLVGRCGVCGKRLEDEQSVERGIGPWCYANSGF